MENTMIANIKFKLKVLDYRSCCAEPLKTECSRLKHDSDGNHDFDCSFQALRDEIIMQCRKACKEVEEETGYSVTFDEESLNIIGNTKSNYI
jgi:hypothetical protein